MNRDAPNTRFKRNDQRTLPNPTQPTLDYSQFKVLNKPTGQGPKINKPLQPCQSMGAKPYSGFSKPSGMPAMGGPAMGGSRPPPMGQQPSMGQPSMGQRSGQALPPMPGQAKPQPMGQYVTGQYQQRQPQMGQPSMGLRPPPMGFPRQQNGQKE